MLITFDTEKLTPEDRSLIAAAIGVSSEAVPEAAAPKATPAKRTAARPQKATPPPAETGDEDEASAEDEDQEGGSDDEGDEGDEDEDLLGTPVKRTVDDAIAEATKLVGDGQQAKVKKALTAVGARKVSDLKAAQVEKFFKALG